jgi:hypothetical protein
LDVEKLLRTAIQKHIQGFLNIFLGQIQHGVLALRDAVSLVTDGACHLFILVGIGLLQDFSGWQHLASHHVMRG